MSRLLYVLLISLLEDLSEGNIRFVCPSPIDPKSDNEATSCNLDAVIASKDLSILQAGLITVTFEETKFQQSSPFRISLLDNSRKNITTSNTNSTSGILNSTRQSCLLLDHIPHNNHAVISRECSQKSNDYPIGICNGSTYHITIRIPDIACEDCTLMLQQVIANEEYQVCDVTQQNGPINNSNCIIFTSCARVRIRPTVSGAGKDFNHCSDYLSNLSGDWPYRPQDLYQADQLANLTLDLLHKNLNIEILTGQNLGPIERVEIYHNLTRVWNVTVTARDIIDKTGAVQVMWESITKTDLDILKDGQLVLRIVGTERFLSANIVYITQHFSESKLSPLHDLYSETGWLVSHKFLGPHSEDPAAAVPWGPCAPEVNYYMAFLQSVHVTAHGILGMTVLENRAYISAVLHVDQEIIQTIRIKGPDLVAIPMIEITIPSSFNGVVLAAFDITEQIPFIGTVRFFKTVEVETDKEDAVLIGDLEEGMYTVLRDEAGDIHGMGAFQFTHGQWLRVEVVVINLSPTIQSAWMYGPGLKLVDLSMETIHCSHAFCCLEDMVHEVTSELLLHLMKGQVVLHVAVTESTVSGEVLGSPLRYCHMVDGSCDINVHQFSMNGLGIKQQSIFQEQADSSVWTATETYVLDRANILNYCVQVDNLNMMAVKKIDFISLEPLEGLSKSYIACNHIPPEDQHLFMDSMAQKWFHFVINEEYQHFLSQDLPAVVRGKCVISKIHDVVKGKNDWAPDSVPLPDIYAVSADQLRFIFGANTDLFIMASEEDMKKCNFKSATQLPAIVVGEGKGKYYYNLNQTGSLYFADSNTCNTTGALKLIVHVIDAGNQVWRNAHDELCSMSLYSIWREKQLQKWEEPEVTSPVVIGLVIGLSSAGAFILWQGIRLKRIPDGFRSNNDNVFIRF